MIRWRGQGGPDGLSAATGLRTARLVQPRVGPQMTRRVGRLAVRGDDEGFLQLRGATVHNARPNNRVTLELDGQSFEEGVALERVDRRCGCPNGGEFVL
jgi:hypothetical protein